MTLFLDANVIIYLIEGARDIRERITKKLASYETTARVDANRGIEAELARVSRAPAA